MSESEPTKVPERIWIRPGSAEYSTVPLNYDNDDVEFARVTSPVADAGEGIPLCPLHQSLEDRGKLEVAIGALGCMACSLNERVELLNILAPCADGTKDSTTVAREVVDFWLTHYGENRVVVSYPAKQVPTAVPTVAGELREQLAALCHEQWSGWMRHVFASCYYGGDEIVIPKESFHHWQRQMKTDYADLSEIEKDSDRKEADRFIALLASLPTHKPDGPTVAQAVEVVKAFRNSVPMFHSVRRNTCDEIIQRLQQLPPATPGGEQMRELIAAAAEIVESAVRPSVVTEGEMRLPKYLERLKNAVLAFESTSVPVSEVNEDA